MAGGDREGKLETKVEVLESTVSELEYEIGALRRQVTAWPAVTLAIAALALPLYSKSEEAIEGADEWSSLWSLAGYASDADNGTVQVFAVILIIAVLAMGGTAIALAVNQRAAIYAAVAAGVVVVVWIGLTVTVGSAGGEGAIGDLDYGNSIRIVLIPIAAAATFAAVRAARNAPDAWT